MQINNLHLHHFQVPLKFQFSQANNAGTRRSDSAILELNTSSGVTGFGEACPRSYVTGESMESMRKDLQQIQAKLFDPSIEEIEDIKLLLIQLEADGIGNSTLCAIELALLDALAKSKQKTMLELFLVPPSAVQDEFDYSLILPLLKPEHMEPLLAKLSQTRFKHIKLKISQDQKANIQNIKLIQACFGEGFSIRVDVNGGWELDQAMTYIPELIEQGVRSFEQPLAASDLEGLRQLTALFGKDVQIMLDETLIQTKQAKIFCEQGIGNHFNLKLSKLGGIFRSLEVAKVAANFGIPCQLGAHFAETSILTHAGIILAQLAPSLTHMEGAMGTLLLGHDITPRPLQIDWSGKLNYQAWSCKCGWVPEVKMPAGVVSS